MVCVNLEDRKESRKFSILFSLMCFFSDALLKCKEASISRVWLSCMNRFLPFGFLLSFLTDVEENYFHPWRRSGWGVRLAGRFSRLSGKPYSDIPCRFSSTRNCWLRDESNQNAIIFVYLSCLKVLVSCVSILKSVVGVRKDRVLLVTGDSKLVQWLGGFCSAAIAVSFVTSMPSIITAALRYCIFPYCTVCIAIWSKSPHRWDNVS